MKIKAEWDGARVKLSPASYLGKGLFELYRAAASPAVYTPALKCQIATIDQFIEVETGLEFAGFLVERTDALQEALDGLEEERALEAAALDVRMLKIDAGLAERGLSLYPYQREGAKFLALRQNALLADDMGCGKTIQVLAALPDEPRVLVVCPAVVRSVWLQEVARFRPDLRMRTIQERKQADAMLPEPGEVVAISYDLLPESAVDLTGIVLVADEAHALKGNKSLRTKRFRRLSDTASRVWILTATPLANRPEELFSVLQAGRLHLEAFGSYEKFLSLYGAKKGRFGMIWPEADKVASPEVRERLDRVMLRRTKAEVLPQLPEKRFRVITVDLASALSRACDDALAELEDMGESLMDSDLEERLPFELLAGLRRKLSIAKFPVLEDLVAEYEAQNEPPVVFSVHRFAIDKLSLREGWRKVTGDESDEERAEAVRLYQAGGLKGIALTIKAGGVGLTLTRGAHALYLDQSFVPAENDQSQDRILRLGQTRGVLITRLVANHPIDLRVDEILLKKSRIIEATLRRRGVASFEDLADLPPEAGVKKKRRKSTKKSAA